MVLGEGIRMRPVIMAIFWRQRRLSERPFQFPTLFKLFSTTSSTANQNSCLLNSPSCFFFFLSTNYSFKFVVPYRRTTILLLKTPVAFKLVLQFLFALTTSFNHFQLSQHGTSLPIPACQLASRKNVIIFRH